MRTLQHNEEPGASSQLRSVLSLFRGSRRSRAGETPERIVEASDPRPPGLRVITAARILMNTPSLGRLLPLSAVQEILRARRV